MSFFSRKFWNHRHHINHHHYDGQLLDMHRLLSALLSTECMSRAELTAKLGGETPSLDDTLSELEQRRIIKREKRPDDKFNEDSGEMFSLTATGRKSAEWHKKHVDSFSKRVAGALSEEEKEQLNAIREKLYQNGGGDEFAHFHFRGAHFGFNEDTGDGGGSK
jgi:DNA-binding MarR family transcriptional regulator